jgi:hypothetical protein
MPVEASADGFFSSEVDANSIELEVDSSLSLPSTLTSRTRKKRTIASNVSPYCRPFRPEAGEEERGKSGLIYYCKLCPESYGAGSTTNFRGHLRNTHGIILSSNQAIEKSQIKQDINKLYDELLAKNEIKEFNSMVLHQVIRKEVVLEKLHYLIAVRNLPLTITQSIEFREFCAALNPECLELIPTGNSTLSASMKQTYLLQQDIVRKALQSAKTRIHLAVDIWTSPNRLLFLAICGSFVDIRNRFWNLLIGLRTIHGHSGVVQWQTIKPVLDLYGITRKIGTVIGDNSGTNDVLCRTISGFMSTSFNMDWNPRHHRIRCHGHILNLVVQAFLFDCLTEEELEMYDEQELGEEEDDVEAVDLAQLKQQEKLQKERAQLIRQEAAGALGKLHNIVVHMRASPNRTKDFLKHAGRLIPLDNRTRWNSWYSMLHVALNGQIKSSVNSYMEKYLKDGSMDKKDVLTSAEWNQLRTIEQFLDPFHQATLETQGDVPSLGQVLELMGLLQEHCETCLVGCTTERREETDVNVIQETPEYKALHSRIRRSLEKLQTYWDKLQESPYYAAACILHPVQRTIWMKDESGDWKSVEMEQAFYQVTKLWERYSLTLDQEERLNEQSYDLRPESSSSDKSMSALDQLRQRRQQKKVNQALQDEFERYCEEPALYELNIPVFQWWTTQPQYPKLQRFALECLSIMGMSDKPERVFSGARRTISWDRAKLGPETVEMLESIKDWKKRTITVYAKDF